MKFFSVILLLSPISAAQPTNSRLDRTKKLLIGTWVINETYIELPEGKKPLPEWPTDSITFYPNMEVKYDYKDSKYGTISATANWSINHDRNIIELKNRRGVPKIPVTLLDVQMHIKKLGRNKLVFTEPFVWRTEENVPIKIDTLTCITIFVRKK